MNSMHDPVVITKKTSRLPWLVAAMTLGLFACQVEDNIVRDNPGDAAGANYHLPTVSVTTPADTTFRDSSSLRIRVRDSSANSRVVRLRWTLDGTVSDSTTDTTWHPTSGLSEGQHVIVVRAVDSTGLVSLPDTVRVKLYNKPPVLAHVKDTALSANKALTIRLSATDSDGVVSKIFWGTTKGIWTDSMGTVALSPMAEGAKKVYWSARDDLGKVTVDSFTATFTNLAPVLTHVRDTTLSANKPLAIKLSATDSDGTISKLFWGTTKGVWTDSTGTVALSPMAEGAKKVYWAARDDLGKVSVDSFTATFTNLAPMLTHVRDTTLSANKPLSIKLSATDSDGTVSKLFWGTTKGIWTDSTGTVALSPMAEGAKKVYWSARDDLGKVTVDSFTATFTNLAPVLTHVRDTTLSANKPLAIKLSATDSDGTISKLFWGTTNGVWTDSTGTVALSPMAEGAKKVYWSARDDLGKVTVDSFTATFTNLAPVLTHVRDTTLLTSQAFAVALSAHDSDGAVKEYLFDTTGNGWDSSVTAPTLRIASTSEGSRKILWGARDDLGKTTTDSFAVTFVMDRPILTAVSGTVVSASKALVVPLNARPLDGSFSAVTKYLWSTNGSTWDSSSMASASLSDTAGGALTVQWKVRNSLGNFSKPDTFVVTFLHAPTITSLSVDSNLTSWTSGTGSLIFSWAGSIANASEEAITWSLSGGTSGLSQLYSGAATAYTQAGIDSGVNYSYRLVAKNHLGDSAVATGMMKTLGPSGSFTDSRDGQTYRYVTIGTQKWMAQNLNYRNTTESSDTVGACYNNSADSCAKYGRLYTWAEAMGLAPGFNSVLWGGSLPRQGVCPSGWHVPSDPEWSILTAYVGESTAGTKLKSTSGWRIDTTRTLVANGDKIDTTITVTDYNGTNDYGFNVLLAGNRSNAGPSNPRGLNAPFWSSSENDAFNAWYLNFSYTNASVDSYYNYKADGFSLRCVQN